MSFDIRPRRPLNIFKPLDVTNQTLSHDHKNGYLYAEMYTKPKSMIYSTGKNADTLTKNNELTDDLHKTWIIKSLISQGCHGCVYRATALSQSVIQESAIKYPRRIDKNKKKKARKIEDIRMSFRNEVNIYKKMMSNNPCKFIAKLLSSGSSPDGNRFLVLEYCSKNPDYYKQLSKMKILLNSIDLLSALEFIHIRNILHCDIKKDNVIYTFDGTVKLTDFSLAETINPNTLIDSNIAMGWLSFTSFSTFKGTLDYVGRDAHLGRYTYRSDMDSFLFLFLEWYLGMDKFPWSLNDTICNCFKGNLTLINSYTYTKKTMSILDLVDDASETIPPFKEMFEGVWLSHYCDKFNYNRLKNNLLKCITQHK